MASTQSAYVEANELKLHYTRTGGGKPPLVLAHGVTDDGLCWLSVAEALADEYDVIMVDARGHGLSDPPADDRYGPVEQAQDLHAVIQELRLERPAVLGHSMGAATSLMLAGLFPQVPGAILLEDPPAWWVGESATSAAAAERQAGMRAWLASLKDKTREQLIAEQRAATPGWSEAELGPWADSKLRVSPNVHNIFSARQETTVDWPDILQHVTCPALLITGDPASGAILAEHHAAALQAFIPQLRIAHVPGAGHNIRRDRFDRFLEIVRAFLKESNKPAAS